MNIGLNLYINDRWKQQRQTLLLLAMLIEA